MEIKEIDKEYYVNLKDMKKLLGDKDPRLKLLPLKAFKKVLEKVEL